MTNEKSPQWTSVPWLVGALAVALLVIAISAVEWSGDHGVHSSDRPVGGVAEHHDRLSTGSEARFVTTIRRPSGPPVIELGQSDPQGRVGIVACSTCHSTRQPNFDNRTPTDLDQFHQNMPMAHGKLACYACHNPSDADSLRLADGTAVDYPDVMTLCAQCHGSQARDYAHGAHGGMNGYWDLSRGPRTRNNCIDCHDPHAPQFPTMQPTFKPRDRFLDPRRSSSHSEADGE